MAGVPCPSGLCLAQLPWEVAPGLTLPLHLRQTASASLTGDTPRLECRFLGPCFILEPGLALPPALT